MSFKVESNLVCSSTLKSYNKSYIKKTRRGKIRKVSNEIYVRNEILCGLNFCTLCYGKYSGISNQKVRNIIFPNFDIFNKYSDFILEDESLNHVVIPYSILDYLSETDRTVINKLRNKLRSQNELPIFKEIELTNENNLFDYNVNQYIRFPDTQFTETCLNHSISRFNFEDCAGNSIIKVAIWFINHLSKSNANIRFYILTENEEWIKKFTSNLPFDSKCFIVNPYEYINFVSNEYVNSGDKLPFKTSLVNDNSHRIPAARGIH
ncbi:mitotic control protein dis3 [Cryptosporidium hominis TU502]|uniref:mitotic control protein dis3 n=1 Tax=Cryptosporidium hominis (strain TU502) TaxID=353151 RepID=UPI0000452B62|nr:mitotic control protein dis3 [Cryptosporidium hominis TU502]